MKKIEESVANKVKYLHLSCIITFLLCHKYFRNLDMV